MLLQKDGRGGRQERGVARHVALTIWNVFIFSVGWYPACSISCMR
jgi:hypothetical protein